MLRLGYRNGLRPVLIIIEAVRQVVDGFMLALPLSGFSRIVDMIFRLME